ncbi:hypothetical protein ROE7235_02707 [Roseibaca ekhonensis]|uniref:DUF2793 domain-containing protein n=1 Tax=Roseinatronobacter ekhonensis TaxID=254356 RepID=A0A3B0MAP8_9RHOB|nr:DUF2793 domain-containing protein [Roseibaca ekhonensis]SUZ32941.1 hypothetical protein ROE7235_02707 [Roseibaca ekhonensis]
MPDTTTNLMLPYILAAQAQKHVTHNEAIRILDGLVQLSVLDRDLTAPPGSPADGDRYIVASGATGDWSGWDLNVALWTDGTWLRLPPRSGWRAWVEDEVLLLVWDGLAWSDILPSELQNLDLIGINATADTTNRLSVSAPAILLSHDGAGHQVKINKAAAGNTASLLYQTGFSGRAEMGLAGSDDFAIKVSPDGSAWLDALVVNRTTGSLTGEAVQSDALDSTTGRLLRVGAFGLGLDAGPNVADLDAHGLAGFFFGYGGASVTPPTGDNPFPTLNGAYGLITGNGTLGDDSGYLWQIAVQYGTLSPQLKFRNKAGVTWDAWQTVVATDNILGSVSQAGGVPTGAIIERGSNANGDYTRFADGTQICTRQGLVATFVDAEHCAATWTCPAAFAAPPTAVTLTLDGGAWGASGPASGVGRGDVQPVAGINTNTALSAEVWASGSAVFVSGDTVPLLGVAFGRWF